jgi:hypothetical protein
MIHTLLKWMLWRVHCPNFASYLKQTWHWTLLVLPNLSFCHHCRFTLAICLVEFLCSPQHCVTMMTETCSAFSFYLEAMRTER